MNVKRTTAALVMAIGMTLAGGFALASSTVNHSALSTSGTSISFPDLGGHCTMHVLLTIRSASRSPSTAQARTSLPDFWRTSPRSVAGPSGGVTPSSS